MENESLPQEMEIFPKDMIVSSTDRNGNILYVNDIFCKFAGYSRAELIGQPHNIIRDPDMPKAIFHLLWKNVLNGDIMYAFIKNKSKNGDFYWVKAYIKPIIENGQIKQFTSYRKSINSFAKEYISNLYTILLEYEKTHRIEESVNFLMEYLNKRGLCYEEFVKRLSLGKGVDLCNIVDVAKCRNTHIIFKYNIIDAVKNNRPNIKVKSSSESEFGKLCQKLENEPYAKMEQWQTMVKHHNHVHSSLERYVLLSKEGNQTSQMDEILSEVKSDTEIIFDNLNYIIDNYKG